MALSSTQGRLVIVDAHKELPTVFWNGDLVPVIDVVVTRRFVVLHVAQSTVIPASLDAEDDIRIRRVS